MSVRRVVPNIRSQAQQESRGFYGLLGFEEVMNQGWIMTLASPSNPTAQVSFMADDRTAPVVPELSVEVDDVDAAYAVMRENGAEIVAGRGVGSAAVLRTRPQRPSGQRAEPPLTALRRHSVSRHGDGLTWAE